MKIVPATQTHFELIVPQTNQPLAVAAIQNPVLVERLLTSGKAWAAHHEGRVLAIFGVLSYDEGVAQLWTVVADKIGAAGLRFCIKMWRQLTACYMVTTYRRVEFSVEHDYVAGHQLARLLGFQEEGRLHRRGPSGKDHILYARWRD